MNAGRRNRAPVPYRRSPGPVSPGGAAATDGSAVTLPALKRLLALLVGGCRRGLELLLDPCHVARVAQEVLEEAPLALADGRPERGRLLVGHVERDVLRRRDRGRGLPCGRVRVDTCGHPLVARREPAARGPSLRRGRRAQELHE